MKAKDYLAKYNERRYCEPGRSRTFDRRYL
jgi:hypothetical protein